MMGGERPTRFPTAILFMVLLLFIVAMIHGVANDWPWWAGALVAGGAAGLGALIGERIDN